MGNLMGGFKNSRYIDREGNHLRLDGFRRFSFCSSCSFNWVVSFRILISLSFERMNLSFCSFIRDGAIHRSIWTLCVFTVDMSERGCRDNGRQMDFLNDDNCFYCNNEEVDRNKYVIRFVFRNSLLAMLESSVLCVRSPTSRWRILHHHFR